MTELSGTLFWWWTSIWYLALASHLKFTAYLFGHGATKHKLLSLNVRGIRSFGRRKSNFNWLLNSSADICFPQETYSIQEVGISIQNFKLYNLYKRELNLIGVVESPNCTFCQEEAESVEHLIFSCRISSDVWKHVWSWLRDNDLHVGTINESDVIFRKFDIVEDYILINHILWTGKYYIYYRKCQNSIPSIRGFIAGARRVIAPYRQVEK